MIRLRLVDDEKKWTFEFFAVDHEFLASGCKRGWKKYRTHFGDLHMRSEFALRKRLAWIDDWQSKKMIQWADDQQKQNQCIDLANFWRRRDSRQFEGVNRMNDRLAIHVAPVTGHQWLTSVVHHSRSQHGMPRCQNGTAHAVLLSGNNWRRLWRAIENIHNHDVNLSAFCNSIAEWADEPPSRPNHLSVVENPREVD
jgi:hypothetical protein